MKREKEPNRINSSSIIILILVLMTGMICSGYAQEQTKLNNIICGIWQGVIKTSGFELQMIFTISQNTDGIFIATLDVPEQNAIGIPVDKITIDSNSVHLEITPIEGVFNGNYTKDGEKNFLTEKQIEKFFNNAMSRLNYGKKIKSSKRRKSVIY